MKLLKKSLLLKQIIKVNFLSLFVFFVILKNLYAANIYNSTIITTDTVWENKVVISGKIIIDRKATLKIKPGTKVLFKKVDEDNDGLSETTIVVNGNIIAEGTKDNPIYFSSLEEKKDWGDWKEIQINHAKGFIFKYAIFEYSEYGIHVHFSEGTVSNCVFRKNADSTRLGNSIITFTNNLFEQNNGKAINFTNCKLTIRKNTIRNNRDGVFVFEKAGDIVVEHNNIYDNKVNVKTGDFFRGKLVLGENYFGENSTVEGLVECIISKKPFVGVLPDMLDAYLVKVLETNGFVDGAASLIEDTIFFPSFDGSVYWYNTKNDSFQKFSIGEFLDCKPLLIGKTAVLVDWDGNVTAIDFEEKKKLWMVKVDNSSMDDHRMPSPILVNNDIIAVARPDGKLYLIDLKTGLIKKRYYFEEQIRATPLIYEGKIYFFGTYGNVFSIDIIKENIERTSFNASFYSPPIVYKRYIVNVEKTGKLFFIDKDLKLHKIIDLKGSFRHQSPIEFNGKLYLFSLDGKLFIIDENSFEEINLNKIFTATPAIFDDYLIVPTFNGELLFYSKKNYLYLGNFGEIQFQPFVYDNRLYLGTRSNKIYVLKLW